MELSELTAYAKEKYGIEEDHKWKDFPGFSVLCHPRTGKWIALLMRQWDMRKGEEIQLCDLKCGRDILLQMRRPFLYAPYRMKGEKWVGIAFGGFTDSNTVLSLFDLAYAEEEKGLITVFDTPVESSPTPSSSSSPVYQETAIPQNPGRIALAHKRMPEKIIKLRQMMSFRAQTMGEKAADFYKQAVFMEDYEDDTPMPEDMPRYYPLYRDLSVFQLRGYFSWRTKARKGEYLPVSAGTYYIYAYELLNGIGASEPMERVRKLDELKNNIGFQSVQERILRQNLEKWMYELCILFQLDQEEALKHLSESIIEYDRIVMVLHAPSDYTDEEVYDCLKNIPDSKIADSPVTADEPERGMRLFAQAWRNAVNHRFENDRSLTEDIFGIHIRNPFFPLSTAVFFQEKAPEDCVYELNANRIYRCTGGRWQEDGLRQFQYDSRRMKEFLHAADARFRRYLSTKRYLKEKDEEKWALPYIEAAIEEDRKAVIEASRPKIEIDFSSLDKIRTDASYTRDSLLVDEEEPEETVYEEAETEEAEEPEEFEIDIALEPVYLRIVRALLRDENPESILKENRIMASIAADTINEAFYDEIGDSVVESDGDVLVLVDDYRDETAQLIGGV